MGQSVEVDLSMNILILVDILTAYLEDQIHAAIDEPNRNFVQYENIVKYTLKIP